MQDRFKFRVWDKKLNKLSKWGDNPYHNMEIMNYICVVEPVTDWKREDYVLMQCTGLKDKNGKLIFEGDIVKVEEHNLCKEGELFKVFYQKILCQFLAKSLTTGNCIDLCDLYKEEAIGNIYENPELLGEGK